MPDIIQLEEDEFTTLDAAGNGFVVLGPVTKKHRWNIAYLTVSVSAAPPQPRAYLFGPNGVRLDATYTGAANTTDVAVTLAYGMKVRVEWVGGVPGARATAGVSGKIEVI